MELLVIDGNKLKISLTREELSSYALTCENIDYSNTQTRKAFWCILDEVRQKTGFDAAADKIYVQVYPSRQGGCEMFVTRLASACGEHGINVKKEPACREPSLFRFASLPELLAACAALAPLHLDVASAAYAVEEGDESAVRGKTADGYYLLLGADTLTGASAADALPARPSPAADRSPQSVSALVPAGTSPRQAGAGLRDLLSEFGEPMEWEKLSVLREHSRGICEKNAIDTLARLK